VPNELRLLEFSYEEIAQALRQHGSQIKISFPQACISSICLDKRDEDTICLQLKSLKDVRHFNFTLTVAQMAACLISYCMAHKIVIPHRGSKTIKLTRTGIVLQITLPRI
jgi:hypothetical protein